MSASRILTILAIAACLPTVIIVALGDYSPALRGVEVDFLVNLSTTGLVFGFGAFAARLIEWVK